MDDTGLRVAQCFVATFVELNDETVRTADVDNVASWDSTQMLTLTAMLEEQFGFKIPEKDVFDLTSYDAVVSYVRQRAESR